MTTWQRRVATFSATLALLVPSGGVGPVAAESPVHLRVLLDATCLSGIKPSDDTLTLKLRRADGKVLDTYSDATPSPFVFPCFSRPVRAGYRIRMLWAGHVREVKVPDLTIAADRVTDVISGHGPHSKHIIVKYAACGLGGCAGYTELGTSVSSHGRWHKDLTSRIDLKGSDRLAASYTNGHGDTFDTPEGHVPYLQLSRPNRIHLECQPDRAVQVTLKGAGGALRAGKAFGKAGACATHNGTFRRNGAAVNIAVGNVIRSDLASDARVVWPHISASWVGEALSLRCLPDAPISLRVFRTGSQLFLLSAATDADGHLDFSPVGSSSQSGDVMELTCATTQGDRITFSRTVP